MKAAGAMRAEIAAVLGHGSDATSGRRYARTASGGDKVKAQPDPKLVAWSERKQNLTVTQALLYRVRLDAARDRIPRV